MQMDFFGKLPEIDVISDERFDPVWADEFHHNNSHELLYIIKGENEITYQDGSSYLAKPGDVLINPATIEHKDIFDSDKELTVLLIHFRWEQPEDFFTEVNNASLATLTSQTAGEIKIIFDSMRYDKGLHEMDYIVANARLMHILSLIYRDVVSPSNTESQALLIKQKQLVVEAKKYVNRFFRDPIKLDAVAADLHVSTFYLSRIFSNEHGSSLIAYLTDIRINEAKNLLKDGRYIIADVASMVGYEDSNYFSKVFKRLVGSSPRNYS